MKTFFTRPYPEPCWLKRWLTPCEFDPVCFASVSIHTCYDCGKRMHGESFQCQRCGYEMLCEGCCRNGGCFGCGDGCSHCDKGPPCSKGPYLDPLCESCGAGHTIVELLPVRPCWMQDLHNTVMRRVCGKRCPKCVKDTACCGRSQLHASAANESAGRDNLCWL